MTTATTPATEAGLQTTQPKALKPVDDVRATLERLKPQMALAMPRHLTPERLCRVAMTAIQTTPKLLKCDRTSLLRSIMTCAQLGLEPDGTLGQAYLVPFKERVQLVIGYRGLIALARNSGEVESIMAQEVREHDRFEYAFGLEPKLIHVPAVKDRGDITFFYAVAKFTNGGSHFEVLSRAEVEDIRDSSSGYKTALRYAKAGEDPQTPWVQNFGEMGKKTAIRRMSKFLPMNVQKAAAISEMYESGRHAELGDAGELVVDVPAEDVQPALSASTASSLDQFAGTGASEPETDAEVVDEQTGEITEATTTTEPALLSPARVEQLREMAESKGLDADEIAASIAGCGLAHLPASFDTTVMKKIQDYVSPRQSRGGRR